MTGVRPPRWRESALGGHRLRAACVVDVPAVLADDLRIDIAQRLERRRFRRDPRAETAARGAWVLRRGTAAADALLTGTGLGLIATRIGPLSYRGVVVLEARSAGESSRVIASLLTGHELAPEFAAVVDEAIDAVVRTGARVGGPGWMRPVDLPADSLSLPRAAEDVGIR